jgi:hypothetical protein
MISVDNIDRTVHRFQPEPLNSVKTATIQVFLVDRQERLAGCVGRVSELDGRLDVIPGSRD